jgi:adenylate cyclase
MEHMDRIQPAMRETLQRLQEIIGRERGAPLAVTGLAQVEAVLTEAFGRAAGAGCEGGFLSREVTILLADLRGFTAVSALHPAGVVLELLNRYLVTMSEIIYRHLGTIDKFMGDSIMVLFGAPTTRDDDVRHALACAVEMQLAMDKLNEDHKERGMPEFYMGIGINTGTVMAGLLGSELYSEYTVIGDQVNLASRIEAYSLRGQVLISEATFERCRGYVETAEPMEVHVKGKEQPVTLRELLAIPSLGKEVPRQEIRRSPRVEVRIPFTYQLIENKIIMPQVRRGTLLDISYHGVLAELEEPLPAYSDIKLDLDMSLIGYHAADVYAKVLKTKPEGERYASGIEFTSVSVQSNLNIKHFVQLLIQGSENR